MSEPIKTLAKEAEEILLNNPLERFMSHLSKTVKRDEPSKKAIFENGLSAYTYNPINLFEQGPSSIGKTYVTIESVKYIPPEDIWFLGGLSPTAFAHEYGNYDKERKVYVIELWNKILVFLDPPHPTTFLKLRPILSHDKEEIMYKFTDKTKSGSLQTKTAIIKGWPATIFCTTEVKYLEDLKTRSLTITPEMSPNKYHEANRLKGRKWARPWEFEDDHELEVLRECIRIIKPKMKNLEVLVPYGEELGEVYYYDLPRDMRDFGKFGSFIFVNAYLNMYQRPIFKVKNKRYLIATREDYEDSRDILGNVISTTRTGLSMDQLTFYNHIMEDTAKEKEAKKEIKWLTWEETIEKFPKVFSKTLGRSSIRERYVKPLEEVGWIDIVEDPSDKRREFIKPIRVENYCVALTQDFSTFFSEKEFKSWLDSFKNYYDGFKVYIGIIGEALNKQIIIDDDFCRNNFGDNQSLDQAPFDQISLNNIALDDRNIFQGDKGEQ